ncbi:hypothetical protein PPL_05203 [Heterostelium album PN500]|uniref:Legume lectin domain-containing protein n=1 Tax=Heterostelium pallidum (strain ATCC 26659 / Pp 5 / PN500) TaxID=670386 RepID=D3B9Q7_HETP5|nr:hypothetical protein PPL_05203 [Heterostelium album PN500]EFA81969.1 hypothetical protein PPL_05203 [Heterostelium album PN500]|eukprot:XP_020434086.1 hypothetical protein PPL_05203 [Heterostelium album PN500]
MRSAIHRRAHIFNNNSYENENNYIDENANNANYTNEYTSTIDYGVIQSIFNNNHQIRFIDYKKEFTKYIPIVDSRVMNSSNSLTIGREVVWGVDDTSKTLTMFFDDCNLEINNNNSNNNNINNNNNNKISQQQPPTTNIINKSIWFKDPLRTECIENQGFNVYFDIVNKGDPEDNTNCFTFIMHITSHVPKDIKLGFTNIIFTLYITFNRDINSNCFNITIKSYQQQSKEIVHIDRTIELLLPQHNNNNNNSSNLIESHSVNIVYNPFIKNLTIQLDKQTVINQLLSIPTTATTSNNQNTLFNYFGFSINSLPTKKFCLNNVNLELGNACQLQGYPSEMENAGFVVGNYQDTVSRDQLIKRCLVGDIVLRRYIKSFLPLIYLHPSQMVTLGNANWQRNSLQLTPPLRSQIGICWSRTRLNIGSGFFCRFKMRMELNGGDGLAFVIQNAPAGCNAIDYKQMGGYLGYNDLPNSLAIEFDTYRNNDEPNDSHVSIQSRGTLPNSSRHQYSLANIRVDQRMNNGRQHDVIICYNGASGSLDIVINNYRLTTVLKDLGQYLGLHNDKQAFVGFTASTGDAYQSHIIEQFELYKL